MKIVIFFLLMTWGARMFAADYSNPIERWDLVIAVEAKDRNSFVVTIIKDSRNLMKDETARKGLEGAFSERLIEGKKERWLYSLVIIDGRRFDRIVDMDKIGMDVLKNSLSNFELRPDFHFVK